MEKSSRPDEPASADTEPGGDGEAGGEVAERDRDEVDEEGFESFPASDPPASWAGPDQGGGRS
ncbi:MAG: hypothetical protein JWM85_3280 [Acidimicrobiaceae bacterium]|nr:hypothetical protein [Acidimicrobiaceae bacterium]